MKLRRIQVECYAGGRADERPRRVIACGREHTITRLLTESVEQSREERTLIRRYRVLTDGGRVLEIVRTGDGRWYLQSMKPAQ